MKQLCIKCFPLGENFPAFLQKQNNHVLLDCSFDYRNNNVKRNHTEHKHNKIFYSKEFIKPKNLLNFGMVKYKSKLYFTWNVDRVGFTGAWLMHRHLVLPYQPWGLRVPWVARLEHVPFKRFFKLYHLLIFNQQLTNVYLFIYIVTTCYNWTINLDKMVILTLGWEYLSMYHVSTEIDKTFKINHYSIYYVW